MTGSWHDPKPIKALERLASQVKLTKATRSGRPEKFKILPHARDFFNELLGRKRINGTRQYRRAYWSSGRKNAKTQNAALLSLGLLLFDAEARPEIYVAATEAGQAGHTFEAVRDMIRSNAELDGALEIVDYKKLIVNPRNGGIFQSVSSTGSARHGSNPSSVIFDELHMWGSQHQELYDALTTGSGARRQPLTLFITTAGSDERSICGREYAYAKRVLDGIVKDDTYLVRIHELPKDADWCDESLWYLPNPALDVIVDRQQLREARDAALESPHKQNTFRRLHLNQWTESDESWIPMHVWDENAGEVDLEKLAGVPAYGGLDLGAVNDLTAFVLYWELDGYYYCKPWFFISEDGLAERSRRDGVRYDLWAERGLIELTPGGKTDWIYVTDRITQLARQFNIRMIAHDPYGARDANTRLTEDGLTVVEFQQNFKAMNAPSKRLEELAIARLLRHGAHDILRWNNDCTTVAQDARGYIMPAHPDRHRSSKRNDGIVALVMAIGCSMRAEPEFRSVYENPLTAIM